MVARSVALVSADIDRKQDSYAIVINIGLLYIKQFINTALGIGLYAYLQLIR